MPSVNIPFRCSGGSFRRGSTAAQDHEKIRTRENSQLITAPARRRQLSSWFDSLAALRPPGLWELTERLPAHAVAARSCPNAAEMMHRLLADAPHSAAVRDAQGRLPLHVACGNASAAAEGLVEALLEWYPLAAHAQDHRGMLPLHHAALSAGPCAGSVAGRRISVVAAGVQVRTRAGRRRQRRAARCGRARVKGSRQAGRRRQAGRQAVRER